MHTLTAWLHMHPHWAGLIAFLISLGESLALLGLLVPGSVTMSAVGTLIGSGVIPATETFIWATMGSILGDTVSFWLGAKFHRHLRNMWPFRLYPSWLDKGEVFFKQHGGKSVFLGRFIGPMRPVVPMVAGMMSMPFKHFLPICVVASIGWAPAYMLPGILIGAAVMETPSTSAAYFLLESLLVVLLAIAVIWFVLGLLEKYLHEHPYKRRYGFIALNIFLLLGLIFCIQNVVQIQVWNQFIYDNFQSLRNSQIDHLMWMITLAANKEVITSTIVIVFVWLGFQRHFFAAFHWLGNGVLGMALIEIFKKFMHIQRPPATLLSSYTSFPSGHVALCTLVMGCLALFIREKVPINRRWLIYFALSLPVILIALSRLYLGAHWFSDVVGGVLIGLLAVQITALSYEYRINKIPVEVSSLLVVFVLGLGVSWGWTYHHRVVSDKSLYHLTPPVIPEKLAGKMSQG